MGRKGYVLSPRNQTLNPADATSYYLRATTNTGATDTRVPIRKAGTIKKITAVYVVAGTLGSAETFSAYLNKNGATAQTLITNSAKMDAVTNVYTVTGLNIPVVVGDYINIQTACPTWVTNPTNVNISTYIRIE